MKQLKKTASYAIVDQKLIVQLTLNVLLQESFIKQQLCIIIRKILIMVQLENNSKVDFMNIRNPLEIAYCKKERKYKIK